VIRNSLGIGFSLTELAAVFKLRDRGDFPCLQARKIAEEKLDQLRARIKDLTAMRRQLETVLKDWDNRLIRIAKGQPARLLENLPDISPQIGSTSRSLNSWNGDKHENNNNGRGRSRARTSGARTAGRNAGVP
jgi:MerR, DNA binding